MTSRRARRITQIIIGGQGEVEAVRREAPGIWQEITEAYSGESARKRGLLAATKAETEEALEQAQVFFDAATAFLYSYESPKVEALLQRDASGNRASPWAQSYKRLRNKLRFCGCDLATPTAEEEGRVREQGGVVLPKDRNLCLSMVDLIRYGNGETSAERAWIQSDVTAVTATEAMNQLSNKVERTLIFGSSAAIDSLVAELSQGRQATENRWGPNVMTFYDALLQLVLTGPGVDTESLKFSYLNAFQRLVGRLVQFMDPDPLANRRDLEVLGDFASWERNVRMNMTDGLWDEHPQDLVGTWTLVESDDATLLSSPEALVAFADTGTWSPMVRLQPGGLVSVASSGSSGADWSLAPGPTHLDTCYITVRHLPRSCSSATACLPCLPTRSSVSGP